MYRGNKCMMSYNSYNCTPAYLKASLCRRRENYKFCLIKIAAKPSSLEQFINKGTKQPESSHPIQYIFSPITDIDILFSSYLRTLYLIFFEKHRLFTKCCESSIRCYIKTNEILKLRT